MKTTAYRVSLIAMLTAACLVGCKPGTDPAENGSVPETSSTAGHTEEEHDHPTEGPHGGELIELGDDEYHAELIHPAGHDDEAEGEDEAEEEVVTIYILDGSAKETVAIEAAEVTINMTHDGEPEQFKLAASPDEGDAKGTSSRFVSSDAVLLERMHGAHIEFRLVVEIEGKSYNGEFHHHHDH